MYLPLFVEKNTSMIFDHSSAFATSMLWGVMIVVFLLLIATKRITFKK